MTRVRDVDHAIDLFDSHLASHSYSPATRKRYVIDILYPFAEWLDRREILVHEITKEHEEDYARRWSNLSRSTIANNRSILNTFNKWLYNNGVLADRIVLERPKKLRAEEVDVTTVSTAEVLRLMDAAREWDEILCIYTLVYLGPRRTAAALVRRRDVDLERGTIRFREKGGKVITKPMPSEYAALIAAADEAGVWGLRAVGSGTPSAPDAYLIPNRRASRRVAEGKERSSKFIQAIVYRLGERAGVKVHPHALRAAFAVAYLDRFDGDTYGLQKLMGHTRPETTQIYLRRHSDFRAMEKVRDLSWGVAEQADSVSRLPDAASASMAVTNPPAELQPSPPMPPTGFEPVFQEEALPEPLRLKLRQLRARSSRERT